MLIFDHRIKHSSAGGNSRRRMFTLNFQERYPVEDIEDLKNEISGLESFWAEKPYGNIMIKNSICKENGTFRTKTKTRRSPKTVSERTEN